MQAFVFLCSVHPHSHALLSLLWFYLQARPSSAADCAGSLHHSMQTAEHKQKEVLLRLGPAPAGRLTLSALYHKSTTERSELFSHSRPISLSPSFNHRHCYPFNAHARKWPVYSKFSNFDKAEVKPINSLNINI